MSIHTLNTFKIDAINLNIYMYLAVQYTICGHFTQIVFVIKLIFKRINALIL